MLYRMWTQVRSQWIGCLALLLTLTGGTAYAAGLGRNTVTAKQIAPNAVRSSELANNAVTGREVRDGSLTAKDLGSLPAGPQGPKGDPGVPGTPGPAGPSEVVARFKDAVGDLPNDFQRYGSGVNLDLGKTPVVTVPLPAGRWHIQAKGLANGDAGNAGCALVAGPNFDGAIATLHANSAAQMLTLQVLHEFTTPGDAELRCTDYGGTVRGLLYIKVHATRVQTIANTAAP